MADPNRKQELIAVSPAQLHVGAALRFTLRDEHGRVLLAKGLRIEDQKALEALQLRKSVFVEYEESDEAVKVLMSGLTEANRRDAPLKDIDKYVDLSAKSAPDNLATASLSQAWTEAETRLKSILIALAAGGSGAAEGLQRLDTQVMRAVNTLLGRDREAALFLLIYRAVSGFSGYSALHSLLCAAVAQLLAPALKLSDAQAASLTRAALTMNLSMTQLQDLLAGQKHRPTPVQQQQIDRHTTEGVRQLRVAGVTDALWLETVQRHHDELPAGKPLAERPPGEKLARILQVVDRYTAAMSPRVSRAGRDAKDAARSAIVQTGVDGHDEVGLALMQNLGLYPAGTYVKLANGETAVVLRRGAKPNEPFVASVLNRNGEPIAEPRMHHSARPEFAVVAGVSASSVRVRLNPDAMLRQLAATKTGAERAYGL
jgi:HD-GYP domain-containing protein (c-di-GMP phosphodiesterase class II)